MAALHDQELQSRTSKSIGHKEPAATGFSGQDASLLDSLRITPQERSLLQDLLATPQPQNIGPRVLDVVQSKPSNAASHAHHDSNRNSDYSNSEGNAQRPQEEPYALGALAEIADIERAWEFWHNYYIS